MKKLMIFATTAMIVSNLAHAAGEQSDAREAHESTVKTSTVKYSCQNGKKLSVKYGFNKQGIPTYAEAKLSGKNVLCRSTYTRQMQPALTLVTKTISAFTVINGIYQPP